MIKVSSVEEVLSRKMMKMGVPRAGTLRLLSILTEEQITVLSKSDTALKTYIDEVYFQR